MDTNIVYLITGANRGIGFALVEDLIDRPNTTILACVRDPAPPAITALLSLSPPPGNHLHILPYDASVPWSPDVLLPLITAQHINHINVLIANAGTEFGFHSIAATSVSDIRDSLEINTLAPIALFQACWPLMERSTLPEKQQQGAKFVFVSSMLGSIGVEAEGAALAYGISKVAMNFFVRKVHFEYPACVSIALSPGWVKTGMGNSFAEACGMQEAPQELADVIPGLVEQIDGATKTTTSGAFVKYDGTVLPW